jgi:putative ABC transport system permease protein
MIWNTLLLALRAIRRNLMRSVLTILGIVIGVAAVITMVTLGNGATKSVSDQISSMGSNLIMVVPGQRFGPGSGGAPNFKITDVEAIRNQISAAEWVAPVVNKSVTAVYQSSNWATVATGSSNDYFQAGNWELAQGRIFSETEERAGKAVCVIGDTVRENSSVARTPWAARSASSNSPVKWWGCSSPKASRPWARIRTTLWSCPCARCNADCQGARTSAA